MEWRQLINCWKTWEKQQYNARIHLHLDKSNWEANAQLSSAPQSNCGSHRSRQRGRGTQVERRIETGGDRCGRQIGRMEIKADNRKEEAENLEAFMEMYDI